MVVYHLEIGLLFLTLVLVGPLVRLSILKPETEPRQNPIGFAEFPTCPPEEEDPSCTTGNSLALSIWRASVGSIEGGLAGAFAYGLPYVILAGLATVVVLVLARVAAKSTVYTITSARVAMRIGAALTVTLNIPFRQLASASLEAKRGGTGTIALDTLGETKFSWLMLWPHLRPWHVRKPQPALRCIPDVRRVAAILAEAAEAKVSEPVVTRAPAPILAAAE